MSVRGLALRLLNSYCLLWILLALPGAMMTWRWWSGASFYGEYLHATGELGMQLLIATLAVTPLRLLFAGSALARWLLPRRRHFGVAAFGYSLLHAGAYVVQQPWERIVGEAAAAAMWTGWLALLLMLALALTSNDAAVRYLKRGWKLLHRAVYAVAVLSLAHWILSAFDPVPGYVHLGILAALESVRLWKEWTNRRARHGLAAPARGIMNRPEQAEER